MNIWVEKVLNEFKNGDKLVKANYTFIDNHEGGGELRISDTAIFVMNQNNQVIGMVPRNGKPFNYFDGTAIKINLLVNATDYDCIYGTKQGIYNFQKGIVFVSNQEIRVLSDGFETVKLFNGICFKRYDKNGLLKTTEIQEKNNSKPNKTIALFNKENEL